MVNVDEVEKELRKLENRKKSTAQNLVLFVVSLGLFTSFGFSRLGVQDIYVLAFVILFHELGHLLAMKYFGYRDVQMFFIPLFGGGAYGRQKTTSGTEQAIVSIMGPLAGILMGMVGGAFYLNFQWEPLSRFAMLSFVINIFNLIPIYPLDGGKFLDSVLFSRSPRVESVVRVLAVIVLGLLAFVMKSPLFGVIAFLTLVSISATNIQTRVIRRLNLNSANEFGLNSDEIPREKLELMTRELEGQFTGKRYSAKTVAHYIRAICRKVSFVPPAPSVTAGLLVLYVVVFVVGTVGPVAGYFKFNKPRSEIVQRILPDGRAVRVQVRYIGEKKIGEIQLNKDGLFDGPAIKWNLLTGKKEQEGNNSNGYWQGESKTYDSTGENVKHVVAL